jgi:nitrate reductase beta subunit
MLYDADRIEAAASSDEKDLYEAQLNVFLDPNDPAVIAQARADGVPEAWIEAARSAGLEDGDGVEGRLPAAPGISHAADGLVRAAAVADPVGAAAGKIAARRRDARRALACAFPVRYLANLLTAGKRSRSFSALERMLAMRGYMRAKTVDGVIDDASARVGLTGQIEDMYQIMAIANYEDRFVIPTAHREDAEDIYDEKGSCGFSFGNGCSGGSSDTNLFGAPARKRLQTPTEVF